MVRAALPGEQGQTYVVTGFSFANIHIVMFGLFAGTFQRQAIKVS